MSGGWWSRLLAALGLQRTDAEEPEVAALHPDMRFGTGLWRQHRDRFARAVDRFYTTAVDMQREASGASAPEQAHAAAEVIAQQTLLLNELADRVDRVAEQCHTDHPVEDLLLPAPARRRLGSLPEHMSRAAAKVAEACQAAAMSRIAARTGQDPLAAASAAAAYVTDAQALVTGCEKTIRDDRTAQ